jgi:hypothetical protein
MTAASSFHGTGISLFQLPTIGNPGEERPPVALPPQATGHAIPEEYATIYPVELNTSKAVVPARDMKEIVSGMAEAKRSEEQWVVHSLEKLDEESVTSGDTLAWAAFHAWAHHGPRRKKIHLL